jgi:hypothetical protein
LGVLKFVSFEVVFEMMKSLLVVLIDHCGSWLWK